MPAFALLLAQRALGRLRDGLLLRHGALLLRLQATLAGAGLGTLVHALAESARADGEPRFRLAMAVVVVAAGGLSFLLYVGHAAARRTPAATAAGALAEARACASLLGGGIVVVLHALPHFAG